MPTCPASSARRGEWDVRRDEVTGRSVPAATGLERHRNPGLSSSGRVGDRRARNSTGSASETAATENRYPLATASITNPSVRRFQTCKRLQKETKSRPNQDKRPKALQRAQREPTRGAKLSDGRQRRQAPEPLRPAPGGTADASRLLGPRRTTAAIGTAGPRPRSSSASRPDAPPTEEQQREQPRRAGPAEQQREQVRRRPAPEEQQRERPRRAEPQEPQREQARRRPAPDRSSSAGPAGLSLEERRREQALGAAPEKPMREQPRRAAPEEQQPEQARRAVPDRSRSAARREKPQREQAKGKSQPNCKEGNDAQQRACRRQNN